LTAWEGLGNAVDGGGATGDAADREHADVLEL